jgi:hypothetical protein
MQRRARKKKLHSDISFRFFFFWSSIAKMEAHEESKEPKRTRSTERKTIPYGDLLRLQRRWRRIGVPVLPDAEFRMRDHHMNCSRYVVHGGYVDRYGKESLSVRPRSAFSDRCCFRVSGRNRALVLRNTDVDDVDVLCHMTTCLEREFEPLTKTPLLSLPVAFSLFMRYGTMPSISFPFPLSARSANDGSVLSKKRSSLASLVLGDYFFEPF